jgi:hypothetical protein
MAAFLGVDPPCMDVGSMLTFNCKDAYLDGLVRGLRSGFVTDDEYHHLVQCETTEGGCCRARAAVWV